MIVTRMHQLIIVAMVALVSAHIVELLTYVFDAVTGLFGGLLGFVVLAYANWKASKMVRRTSPVYYLWKALPFAIVILLPLLASWFIDVSFNLAFAILMLRLLLGLVIPLLVLFYIDYHVRH